MDSAGWKTPGTLILGALIGAILFVNMFTPLEDPDFFWHLKTGEWIWQHHALPTADPFAYTTPVPPTSWSLYILTSYWMSQLLYHLLHSSGGFPALIALRFILAGLLFWILFRQNKGNRLVFMSLLALVAVVLRLYPLERPQVFSFICFAALFGLLSAFLGPAAAGTDDKPRWFAVPLLMIVWSNLHGGFLVGQLLILAFLALEGLKFLLPALGPPTRAGYRRLLVAGLLGLAGSLCNPNTWHGLAMLASPAAPRWLLNVDYQSTVFMVRDLHGYRMTVYWLLLLLTLLGFIARRGKPDLTTIAILSGLGLISFVQLRYVPFFLVAAVPCTAAHLSAWGARKWFAATLAGLAVCVGLFFSWKDRSGLLDPGSGNWIDPSLPIAQADFILDNDLKGNLYNHWAWGGYLIWRLAPGRKVFIDGRALVSVFEMASHIDNATRHKDTGVPRWKGIFERYNILHVIVPFFTFDGERLPLTDALLEDPEWLPCAETAAALVFVRDTAENRGIIDKFGLRSRKRGLAAGPIALLDRWIEMDPRNVTPVLKKGELLMSASRWAEARLAYEAALKIDPANVVARDRLRQLSAGGER